MAVRGARAAQKSRIYERGPSWYIDVRVRGKRIRRSAGATREEAEELVASLVAEPSGARRARGTPFDLVVRAFLNRQRIRNKRVTFETARYTCTALLKAFGNRSVEDMRPADLDAFVADRLKVIGREAVNKELRYLNAALRQAVEDGAIEKAPCKVTLLRTTRRLPTILAQDEIKRLFAAADARMRPLLLCAAMTGLRKGELRSLWWEDVDFDARTISVRAKPELDFSPKSNSEREVPMNSALADVLKHHREFLHFDGRKDFVFQRKPTTGSRWAATTLCTAVRRVFEDAGLYEPSAKPGLHMLRRSFASHALAAGADVETVRVLGGWASLGVVQRYVASSTDLKRAAVERLSELAS